MSVSVIIPTLLAGPAVEQPLESVARSAAAVDGAEVLIVANGSGPHWHGNVLEAPNVRLLRSAEVGPAAARNLGMAESRHRIVLFTDDDCVVPPTWCRDLYEGLTLAGTTAVAAPVGVQPIGPTTAYLDYQRIFDAPPLAAHTVRYLITANCAVDRTRTSARFEAELFRFVGAEDAEFGQQIRDQGGTIAWLGDLAEVSQTLTEDITQVTDRFHRYGRGSALMYQRCGRGRESVPGATGWLADIAGGLADDRRRFREFRNPRVRTVFATIELVTTASWLLGYLHEMGVQLHHEIVQIDWLRLARGWEALAADLREIAAGVDWATIDAEPRLLWAPTPETDDLRGAIGDVLMGSVRVAARLPDDVKAIIDRHADDFDTELALARAEAAALAAMPGHAELTITDLRRELRAASLPFRDGLHDLEQAIQIESASNDSKQMFGATVT